MQETIYIQHGISIPKHEIEITTSRSGGAGGQHVNKADTRITIRWNLERSQALTPEQKNHIRIRLGNKITQEGDIIIHNSSTRSQAQNKERALELFAQILRKGLYVPKKRKKTGIPTGAKEARLQEKQRHGAIKKMRSKKIESD